VTKAIENAQTSVERGKAEEVKEDLMRLKRVEQIYVGWVLSFFSRKAKLAKQSAILPVLSGWVLVLLKLLLATVSAGTNLQAPQSSTSSVFPSAAISRKTLISISFLGNVH